MIPCEEAANGFLKGEDNSRFADNKSNTDDVSNSGILELKERVEVEPIPEAFHNSSADQNENQLQSEKNSPEKSLGK